MQTVDNIVQIMQIYWSYDLRIGVIATNTMLAGAAGSITAMLYT